MAPGAPIPPTRNDNGAELTATVSGTAAETTKKTMSMVRSFPVARSFEAVGECDSVLMGLLSGSASVNSSDFEWVYSFYRTAQEDSPCSRNHRLFSLDRRSEHPFIFFAISSTGKLAVSVAGRMLQASPRAAATMLASGTWGEVCLFKASARPDMTKRDVQLDSSFQPRAAQRRGQLGAPSAKWVEIEDRSREDIAPPTQKDVLTSRLSSPPPAQASATPTGRDAVERGFDRTCKPLQDTRKCANNCFPRMRRNGSNFRYRPGREVSCRNRSNNVRHGSIFGGR